MSCSATTPGVALPPASMQSYEKAGLPLAMTAIDGGSVGYAGAITDRTPKSDRLLGSPLLYCFGQFSDEYFAVLPTQTGIRNALPINQFFAFCHLLITFL